MSLTIILETFIRSFPSSFNRKYVHMVACTVVFVGPACFVCNAYPGRNATCPLSSCSNKNDAHAVALTDFYRFCKGSVCVEVLTSFYGRFVVEEGQFIKYTPSTSSLHFGSHFIHLLTRPRFGAESSGSQPGYRKLFPHGPHSSKNNFFGIKISQRRHWECPSLSYYGSWFSVLHFSST